MGKNTEMIVLYLLFFGPLVAIAINFNFLTIKNNFYLPTSLFFGWPIIFAAIGYYRRKFIYLFLAPKMPGMHLLEGEEAKEQAKILSITAAVMLFLCLMAFSTVLIANA